MEPHSGHGETDPPGVQEAHDVHYLRHGFDEAQGKIFCLVDAPRPERANTVHREAHGLVADEIHPVIEGHSGLSAI